MTPLMPRRRKTVPASQMRTEFEIRETEYRAREAVLNGTILALLQLLDVASVEALDARMTSRSGDHAVAERILLELVEKGSLSVGARKAILRGERP